MTQQEKFCERAKKIFTKMPKGMSAVYDSHQLRLFFIKDGFEFVDKGSKNSGTSWHGVLSPVNEPNGAEGHVKESVLGFIDISMEAVIYDWNDYAPDDEDYDE